jgi:hypothetical protein
MITSNGGVLLIVPPLLWLVKDNLGLRPKDTDVYRNPVRVAGSTMGIRPFC